MTVIAKSCGKRNVHNLEPEDLRARHARGLAPSPACRSPASTGSSDPAPSAGGRDGDDDGTRSSEARALIERARHPHRRVRLRRHLGRTCAASASRPRTSSRVAARRASRMAERLPSSGTSAARSSRSCRSPTRTRATRDMLAMPDLSTLRQMTWREGTALVMCDAIDRPRRTSRSCSTRATCCGRSIGRLQGAGYEPVAATELEFYLCTEDWQPVDDGIDCYSHPEGRPVRGRAERHPPQDRGVRHRRRGLQHGVRARPDRGQPRPRPALARRRRHVPLQVRGQGDRPPARRARDVHGQAVPGPLGQRHARAPEPARRRGRQRLRRARPGRRRAADVGADAPRRSPACWPTRSS